MHALSWTSCIVQVVNLLHSLSKQLSCVVLVASSVFIPFSTPFNSQSLYQWHFSRIQHVKLIDLVIAARGGVAEATIQLVQEYDQGEPWFSQLKSLAYQGNVEASWIVGKTLHEQGRTEDARIWFKQSAGEGHRLARVYQLFNEDAVDVRDIELIVREFILFQSDYPEDVREALADWLFERELPEWAYQVFPARAPELKAVSIDACMGHIQPVISGKKALTVLQSIQAQWSSQLPGSVFPLCFEKPVMVNLADYCDSQPDSFIQCDLSAISDKLEFTSKPSQLLVITGYGTANYTQGVIHLSLEDTVNTFRHEYFHVYGFMDEYLIHHQEPCTYDNDFRLTPNILLATQSRSPVYRHTAATCKEGKPLKAFKQVSMVTIMEQQDEKVPALYVERLISQHKEFPGIAATAEYAIARQFEEQGEVTRYHSWLTRAVEKGDVRASYDYVRFAKEGTLQAGERHDDGTLFNLLEYAAKSGLIEAQLELAHEYMDGTWIEKSLEKGLYWYLRAGQAGSLYGKYFWAATVLRTSADASELRQAKRWLEYAVAEQNPLAISYMKRQQFVIK